jgi:DNA-binding MarR family transcriptional regulator
MALSSSLLLRSVPSVGVPSLVVPHSVTPLQAEALGPAAPRVGYLIYRVERQLRTRLDEAVGTHGLTTPAYVALSILRERDGLSNAQLARWAFVTPQAMSLVILALERRRLVRRRPDPHHRRVMRTSVTARGLRILDDCDRAMDVIETDMLQGLDPATIEPLRVALSSCAHSLQGSRPLPEPPARPGASASKLPAEAAETRPPQRHATFTAAG